MNVINVFGEVEDLRNPAPVGDTILNYNYTTKVLSWLKGGEQSLVVASLQPLELQFYNNITYPVKSKVGDGRVVYRGKGDNVDLTDFVDPTLDYYFYVISFNGVASNEVYHGEPTELEVPAADVLGIGSMIIESSFIIG